MSFENDFEEEAKAFVDEQDDLAEDDEELEQTPQDVIDHLGYDPLDEDD
jgi:hypothetical protein